MTCFFSTLESCALEINNSCPNIRLAHGHLSAMKEIGSEQIKKMSFKATTTKNYTVFLDLLCTCQTVEAVHHFRKEWVPLECRVEQGWET